MQSDDLIGDADRKSTIEALFYENLPKYRGGRDYSVNVPALSKDLQMSRQGVYLWFSRGRISNNKLQELVDLPESTLTLEMLYPLSLREE